jgi:hypothetical protein
VLDVQVHKAEIVVLEHALVRLRWGALDPQPWGPGSSRRSCDATGNG